MPYIRKRLLSLVATFVVDFDFAALEEQVENLRAWQHNGLVRQIPVVRDVLNTVGVVVRVQTEPADKVFEFLSDSLDHNQLFLIRLVLLVCIHGGSLL